MENYPKDKTSYNPTESDKKQPMDQRTVIIEKQHLQQNMNKPELITKNLDIDINHDLMQKEDYKNIADTEKSLKTEKTYRQVCHRGDATNYAGDALDFLILVCCIM